MIKRSLKAKVTAISIIVGLIVATLVGVAMYFILVKPVESRVQENLIKDSDIFIEHQIEQKSQVGVAGATAFSLAPNIINALGVEDRDSLVPFFKGIKAGYAKKTNYKNIGVQLITFDGRSLIKTWDMNSYGKNVSNSPIIKKAMEDKQAFGMLAVGDRGVGIISVAPIFDGEDFSGLVTFVQGLASVAKNYVKMEHGMWVMLVDRRYIQKHYGSMPVIDKNEAVDKNYILASNRWFPKDSVDLLKKVYEPIDGKQTTFYIKDNHVIMDLPVLDVTGEVMGRHMFMLPASFYYGPLAEAKKAAWLSLAGVMIGIFILAFALVVAINKMVVNPLARMQKTTDEIMKSGDFSIRVDVTSEDEVGRTALAVNDLLSQVGDALKKANGTISAIAAGDFSKRIEGDYHGDLNALKNGMNQSIDNIADVIKQIATVMDEMKRGHFDVQLQNTASGEYYRIIDSAQQTMTVTNSVIYNVNQVMESMHQGNFGARVDVEAHGELRRLKDSINSSLDSLNKAMSDITRIVVAQSEGDLTQLISTDYPGELGRLRDAVNQSVEKLSAIVGQVIEASDVVNTASQEVAQGALDLSSRVQRQAAALEQTSASMEEMNAAVQNNSSNSVQVSGVVQKVQSDSSQANDVMHQTIDAMNAIQESSHKISDIVTLIDGIAFQTNLLALNAAVEAARAGEHGRGFAVVAGEVRSLAQKSAEAAKNITSLINESVDRINQGTKLATESGQVLEGITEQVESVASMIRQIAQASEEQAKGVEQVHQAMNDLDSATQQNAALVEQTSAAAESMSEQAVSLSHNIAFFKTNKTHLTKAETPKLEAKPKSEPAKRIEAKKEQVQAKPKAQEAKPAAKPEAKPAAPKESEAIVSPLHGKPAKADDEWEDF
ncbi:methyl-accepting chemotaxis protein [Hydrogenovibrio sp. JE_KL2]|uniref:methyl-accepting chemotaxis protein n=1 Tax=Hydrogenovibrio sp. JE_KL2 TaxID=2651188 RepID=UPI00128D22CA|nr:HAMP domain-containing protein [Hydrogenovibrio sp. JE_KL2]